MPNSSELSLFDLAGQLIKIRPELADSSANVRARLEELVDEARTKWPVWIEREVYVSHIGLAIADAKDPLAALEALHPSDLYLAAAATAGVPAARRRIEELIRRLAKTIVRRMGGGEGQAADTASEVVEKLLVGSETRSARIDAYGGRSSLQGWIRATLSRAYLNRQRKHRREVLIGDEGALEALCDSPVDPSVALVKSQYRVQFSAAFEAATNRLTPRQRTLLRYRFVDGATVDAIAAVFRVHRATCHRWIGEARAVLAKATEAHLQTSLKTSSVDIGEIRDLIESHLELSMSRIFASKTC